MITICIIFSSVSAVALILAILFEGELKKENRKGKLILAFKGWCLIAVTFLMCFGNGYLAVRNIQDSDNKYKEDSTHFVVLLNEATKKRISDSVQILRLKELTLNNGLKSDSMKNAFVDNAVKAMNEQKKIIEKDKENTFTHLQNEIKENLQKILVYYPEKTILFYVDTSMNSIIRLNNSNINKYGSISSQKDIISKLSQTSECIEIVNKYLNNISNMAPKSKDKKNESTWFLQRLEEMKNFLYPLYYNIRKLKSYKEFESINLNTPLPKNYRDELNNFLELDYITGPKLK
jgi:hypothetical protein